MRPRTVESYDGILDRHVLPQLGKRKVRELDAGAIRVWLAGLERQDGRPGELASGTRRLILSTLELVLQHAVEIGALGAVPKIEKKRRPKKGESRRRILSREEEASLLWASPAWLRPIVTVAMREALRLGEVLGLEWSDVDFAAGKLHVRRGLSRDGSFGPCKGQTREDFEHGKGPGSSSPRELARRCSSSAAKATGPGSCSATATARRGGTGTSRVPSRRLAIAPA